MAPSEDSRQEANIAERLAAMQQAADRSPAQPQYVDSASEKRTVNNTMRHQYKVLTDAEKANMLTVKDQGLALHDFLGSLGNSRELSLAKTKVEEAVMWAVKHITG